MPGVSTNQLPLVQPSAVAGSQYFNLTGYERVAVDTLQSSGAAPQSVAPTVFQIAALAAGMSINTATASSGAATNSTNIGRVVSESLSTAAGATYTLTLTNTMVAATSNVQAAAYLGTSAVGGPLQIVSVTPASGSVVIVVKNAGAAAISGTINVAFMVLPD